MQYKVTPLKLTNPEVFQRLSIDPYYLNTSQRKYVDRIITIFKLCLNNPVGEKLIKQLLYDFIDITFSCTPRKNAVYFHSIKTQIDNFENNVAGYKRKLQVSHELLEQLSQLTYTSLKP